MTFPAISLRQVDPGDRLCVAPFTIGLGNFGPLRGQADILRDPPGIKEKGILHPQDALPGKVIHDLIVRQMAVNAFDSTVGPLVAPGLVFGLHDMAACAEFRRFGLGVEFGGTEGKE